MSIRKLLKQTNHALFDAIDLLIQEYTHRPEFFWIKSHNKGHYPHNESADILAKDARYMAEVDITPDSFPRDSFYHNYLHIHNKLAETYPARALNQAHEQKYDSSIQRDYPSPHGPTTRAVP
jgi:hypothetical protein